MLDRQFVLFSALFELIGVYGYIRDTLRGKTKPNRVTWFLWALAPLIAFSAEIKEGVGLQSLMTFMVGFCPLLIFLVSFTNRKSYWKLTRLDIACGLLSLLALILWKITGTGTVAIALSIAADFLAGVPTIIKSLRHPETESHNLFLLGAVAAVFTIITLDHFTLALAGFPIYILLMDLLLYSTGRFNRQLKALLPAKGVVR